VIDEIGSGVKPEKGDRVGVGWHGGQDTLARMRAGDFAIAKWRLPDSTSRRFEEYMLAPIEALRAFLTPRTCRSRSALCAASRI